MGIAMNMIDEALHEIKMAFVLFANAFSGTPPICKLARNRWPFRMLTCWFRKSRLSTKASPCHKA
jgi:hypothetical protein